MRSFDSHCFDNFVIDVFLSLRLSANALTSANNAFVSRTFEKIFFKLTCMQFSRYNPGLYYLCPMGLSGLEPPTSRLSGVRSNQLSYKPILEYLIPYRSIHSVASEWRWRDSNSRPPACKAGALPTELYPHIYFCFAQLFLLSSGLKWTRTTDLTLIRRAL